MGNVVKQTEMLMQFAEEKLKNHLVELNTRYLNEGVDDETKRTAYHNHRQMFEQELNERIQSVLADENNAWLQGDLENTKHTYLEKLLPGQQDNS